MTALPAPAAQSASGVRRWRLVAGVAATAGCAWVLVSGAGPGLGPVLAEARPDLLAAAAGVALAGFLLRGWRWGLLVGAVAPDVRPSACIGPAMAGWALNNLLPLRAGDMWRLGAVPAPAAAVAGTLIVERLLDLAAVLALAAFAAALAPLAAGFGPALAVVAGIVVIGVIGLLAAAGPLGRRWHGRTAWRGVLGGMLAAADRCLTPRGLVLTAGVTAVAWGCEALAIALAAQAVGLAAGPAQAAAAGAAGTLATAIPAAPGHLGTWDLAVAGTWMAAGHPAALAAGAALVAHAVLWLTATIAGLGWLGLSLRRRATP
jgi:uncharacterized membrane protein YbhN (UPF0104 family)